VVIGVDLAKRNDYTVFFAVNGSGHVVGFCRLRRKSYGDQARILARFASHFQGEGNEVRYDRTGVGDAVGEEISKAFERHNGDWSVTPVVFTNASKQEMVSRLTAAIESGWFSSPRLPRFEHELINMEVAVTKSGLHTYSCPSGDHDDCHWAAALAVSGAHALSSYDSSMDMIEAALSGKLITDDDDDDEQEPLDDLDDFAEFDDEVLEDLGAM
jgi:phage FluMu gp28-like protein